MFIKFEDYEMLEFFENEPISVGEVEEGKYIYSIKDGEDISLVLSIDTYAQIVDITIRNNIGTIFSGEFKNVIEIRKNDRNELFIILSGEGRLVLKRNPQVGVIIE